MGKADDDADKDSLERQKNLNEEEKLKIQR